MAELFNVVCFVRCVVVVGGGCSLTRRRGEEDKLWKRSDFTVETEIAGWKPLHDDDAVDTRSSRGNNFIVLNNNYYDTIGNFFLHSA